MQTRIGNLGGDLGKKKKCNNKQTACMNSTCTKYGNLQMGDVIMKKEQSLCSVFMVMIKGIK